MPTKVLNFFSVAVLATATLCHFEAAQSIKPIVLVSKLKPNETSPVPNVTSLASTATIEKRSDDDDDDGDPQGKSIFRSIIPISPFKKPIKTIFRSWFEPNAEALKDDSTSSSFYFIRPQKKAVVAGPHLYSKSVDVTVPQSASPYRLYSNKYTSRQSNGRAQYSYQPSAAASTNQHSVSRSQSGSPTFAIGDPENGRGITFSLGDGPKQGSAQYGLATNQNYQSVAVSPPQNVGSSSSASNGGGGGLSFSLGGRGGGSGLSFSLGGGGGGSGSRGSGLSLSLGGGRGIGLNLGGGGGDSTPEQGSSSSNYPSYSGYGSNSYGSSYGSNNNYYYPTKPKFSITMPSSGKTVIEANMRPPTLKMKVNASPKVKITTGTRDPLEKPPLEEEVIMDDIFGPPAPFEKPMKSNTTDDTLANGFNQTFPYYPYYPPYYHYPYNYYYNYYQQQYPEYYSQHGSGYQSKSPYGGPSSYAPTQYLNQYGSQYGGQYGSQYSSQYGSPYSSQHNSSSTTFKHRPIELAAAATKNNKWQSIPAMATQASTKHVVVSSPYSLNAASPTNGRQPVYKEFGGFGKQQVNLMDHNSVSYKRSSASSSYNKDMLTLGSNSIASYARPDSVRSPKKLFKAQESKNYYHYELSPKQNTGPNSLASSATNTYPYYSQPGTGVGYSYYSNSSANEANNSYPGSYYNPYYNNPYYYNYYKDYYNYAKQYYESYYGNYSAMNNQTGHGNGTYNPYYKSRKSISGFSQDNFDHHQSKIFGSKIEKYPGGSTKEDKTRIIMDIRPRVTFRMLNRTQAEEEQKKLHHHKKKDHMFRTKLTILMLSTTTTPKPLYDHNYYGYNYYGEDDADEFGYTKGATTHELHTTPRPKTTTTRRRTTTTEEPSSSGEGSEEENGSGETTSQEEEESSSTTSTTTTEAPEDNSTSEEVDDDKSKEGTTSTTTSTTTIDNKSEEEVIDSNEEMKDEAKTDAESETQSEEKVEEKDEDENSSLEEASKPVTIPASATGGNVTVSPELVAAMIKALQEALGVTPPSISNQLTTITPIMSTMAPLGENNSEETKDEDMSNTADSSENHDPEPEEPEEEEEEVSTTTTTRKPKTKDSKNGGKSKLIPTVHSTVVKNTTQLRLKTPVLSVQSAKGAASTLVKTRISPASSRTTSSKNGKASRGKSSAASSVELTTTSPFIILSKGMGLGTSKNKADVSKVIDGNAVLSNFNVDDLTDDERRDMLTNILSVIQNKNNANEIEETVASSKQAANTVTSRGSRRKNKKTGADTKLLPVTKANNVRIVSSLDELTKSDKSTDSSSNAPIYVVLLPQNKKKK